MVLWDVIIHSFTCSCSVFPAPFIEEAVFAPSYILASFCKNKICIGAWAYFWTSILFHWSICLFLCQHHTVLMTVALYYNLKSRRLIPPASFFFFKTVLAVQSLLCFHMNCEIFCSSLVKNAFSNSIGIMFALNVYSQLKGKCYCYKKDL